MATRAHSHTGFRAGSVNEVGGPMKKLPASFKLAGTSNARTRKAALTLWRAAFAALRHPIQDGGGMPQRQDDHSYSSASPPLHRDSEGRPVSGRREYVTRNRIRQRGNAAVSHRPQLCKCRPAGNSSRAARLLANSSRYGRLAGRPYRFLEHSASQRQRGCLALTDRRLPTTDHRINIASPNE
jgi:hypothetical protein